MLYYCIIFEENNIYMNIFYYKFCNFKIGGINIILIYDYVFQNFCFFILGDFIMYMDELDGNILSSMMQTIVYYINLSLFVKEIGKFR